VSHLLAQIDLRATAGTTPWHRASAIAKLVVAATALGLAIAAPGPALLVAVHVVAWALALTSGLPGRLVLAAAGYPLVFSALFVAARWDGTWLTPLTIVLRPLTASLVATWLVGTTPYPDLFAPVSRLLPRATGDGLFLTYRALFALFARAGRLWESLWLRGGLAGPPRRRAALAGESLGTLVVHGFERSHRLYGAMRLRGHSGRICGCRHYAEMSRADAIPAAVFLVLAAAGVLLWSVP
jgi:cobalt/nickel transport system permease protein